MAVSKKTIKKIAKKIHRENPENRVAWLDLSDEVQQQYLDQAAALFSIDLPDGHKACRSCGKCAPMAEFYRNASAKDGRMDRCKYCSKAQVSGWIRAKPDAHRRNMLKKYDLTPAQFDEMLEKQGGVCKTCHQPPKRGKRLCVDHCHVTGAVRGLLCNGCNSAIGMMKESPKTANLIAAYMRRAILLNPYPPLNSRIAAIFDSLAP